MQKWQPLEIPAGIDGINRTKNIALTRPSHLAYADNITTERAICEKLPGAIRAHDDAVDGQITGAYEYYYGTPTYQKNVVLYVDDGVSAHTRQLSESLVLIPTAPQSLTTGGFPWFVECWDGSVRFLLLYNGVDQCQIQYGGGSLPGNHPNPSTDWTAGNYPTGGCSARIRTVAYGPRDFPHTLYLSDTSSHALFTGGDSATEIIWPGVGEKIVGAIFYRERVYVGKYPRGIMFLDESDPDPANWSRDLVTAAFGISGPGCMLDIGDDVLILSADGFFYSLSRAEGTDRSAIIPPLMPMETSEFIKEKLNIPYLHKTRSVWYGHKRQAWFSVPTGASTTCNAVIIFDLLDATNPKLLFSSRDAALALAMVRENVNSVQKPAFGQSDGYLYLADREARHKESVGYTGQYETVPVAIMQGGIQRANLEELQVVMQPQGNWDLDLEVLRDGVPSQTLAYSMQTPGAGSGSVSLDSDVIAGQTIATVRHRLEGDCRYLKLIGRNENANENFAVMSHIVRVTPGNDR